MGDVVVICIHAGGALGKGEVITGEYVLELSCDQKEGCAEKATIKDDTRMEALATARYDGWLITRARTALCPTHADERRASWRPRRSA